MNEKPYPRTGCVVPFCRHETTTMPGEWICAEHWRLVPRGMKDVRRRLLARWKRRGLWTAGRKGALRSRVLDRLWKRMKDAAIARAMGLD